MLGVDAEKQLAAVVFAPERHAKVARRLIREVSTDPLMASRVLDLMALRFRLASLGSEDGPSEKPPVDWLALYHLDPSALSDGERLTVALFLEASNDRRKRPAVKEEAAEDDDDEPEERRGGGQVFFLTRRFIPLAAAAVLTLFVVYRADRTNQTQQAQLQGMAAQLADSSKELAATRQQLAVLEKVASSPRPSVVKQLDVALRIPNDPDQEEDESIDDLQDKRLERLTSAIYSLARVIEDKPLPGDTEAIQGMVAGSIKGELRATGEKAEEAFTTANQTQEALKPLSAMMNDIRQDLHGGPVAIPAALGEQGTLFLAKRRACDFDSAKSPVKVVVLSAKAGARTRFGDRYDPKGHTAATWRFPYRTELELTGPNGSTVVTVMDRPAATSDIETAVAEMAKDGDERLLFTGVDDVIAISPAAFREVSGGESSGKLFNITTKCRNLPSAEADGNEPSLGM